MGIDLDIIDTIEEKHLGRYEQMKDCTRAIGLDSTVM